MALIHAREVSELYISHYLILIADKSQNFAVVCKHPSLFHYEYLIKNTERIGTSSFQVLWGYYSINIHNIQGTAYSV